MMFGLSFHRPGHAIPLIASLALAATGCGTNLDEVLFQLASAAGRTYLDLAVTDVANNVVASSEQDEDMPADDSTDADQDAGDDGDADGNGNTDGDGDADGGGGVSPNGAALFATNCAACHGDDGASGFAPDISSFDADALATGLALPNHSSISLADDEVTAIAAFLTGSGGSDGAVQGDATAGAQIFATSGCSACHCEDASGGCALDAPALGGVGFNTLDDMLRGEGAHPGGKSELDDREVSDLQAYLAGI